ncbi:aminopeptidase S-like [Saccoglossus kowalevskii]
MAVLLDAAAMVTNSECTSRNTVIFVAFDLEEWQEELFEPVQFLCTYDGYNIIGVLPGPLIGTASDQVILLGAHYDSVQTTPGVDDNGSGMAVLLDAAAMVTNSNCTSRNTVIFVAFDLEEWQEGPQDICIGSLYFVQEWLLPFLTNDGGAANSSFQGALIMETTMNNNNTPYSQEFPQGFDRTNQSFPCSFNVFTLSRLEYLKVVLRHMTCDYFTTSNWRINLTSSPGVPNENHYRYLGDFFRSDHRRFWEVGPPYLKALFITDTANFRTPMDVCYHQVCDNLQFVTDENLLFLARTALASTNMIDELAMTCPVGMSDVAN